MTEEWRDVEGYEGRYQVSNLGRVKALPHKGKKSGIKKATKSDRGYLAIGLSRKDDSKTFRVHRLVASAFIPNPDCLIEVNHKDGIKANNHVSNLEWSTRGENMRHAYRMGLLKIRCGEQIVHKAKLTLEQVKYIVAMQGKITACKLAASLGISDCAIHDIYKGRSWKRVLQNLENQNI